MNIKQTLGLALHSTVTLPLFITGVGVAGVVASPWLLFGKQTPSDGSGGFAIGISLIGLGVGLAGGIVLGIPLGMVTGIGYPITVPMCYYLTLVAAGTYVMNH
jgi:hypothetical protein